MTALEKLLDTYRTVAVTEREKGTYFEELICTYLRNEATYKDLYSDVWTYADWAKLQGIDGRDAGIDLVAKTQGTGEFHAIQCKLYATDYKLQKKDIDSFFTASGKKPFSHRIIVSTTNHWSEHAEASLENQQPPVSKIDLNDLEHSQIDWSKYQPRQAPALKPQKTLRPHQQHALDAVRAGLKHADRGKLIMACGTGKTFTSLKIAEELAGKSKRVLFLVPSLALLSQTLTEWTQESGTPLHNFAVCSDSDVGKKRKKDDDSVQTYTHELRYPATTEPKRLAEEMAKRYDAAHMSVVYSTYHSIDVISRAQKEFGLADFDLIVCDEAHRTTGATFGEDDESNFVKVHDAGFIGAAKRVYMTATPRIYGDTAKASAEKDNVALASMDDEALYGKTLYVISFSEAVKRGLLVDYKVIVLSVEESHVSRRIQGLLKDENNQLRVDDAAKIIGCWKALAKQGLEGELNSDAAAMKRAVAFCQVIEVQKGAKTHKVSSKNIANMFQAVVEAYQGTNEHEEAAAQLACEAAHVDGNMNASEKEEKLNWLKAEAPNNTCRILSNVRCLSEGVDVPALDAVLFLTPRNSQVDVVQSVGRVMRNAPGKQRGYIVLPVVIPAGVEPHDALNDNKTYKVVWQVLQALRSHDDRFDAMINKLELIGKDTSKMEVIAVTDRIQRKAKAVSNQEKLKRQAKTGGNIGNAVAEKLPEQQQIEFEIGEIERAIYAKLVQKVGNRHHWEDWANDIARIAATHVDRIRGILGLQPRNSKEKPISVQPDQSDTARTAFIGFANELRDDLNDSISDAEVIEMLAQHLITKPVFDALFDRYSFAQCNPMSQAMQGVLDVLHEHHLDKEAGTLQSFYDSVRLRAEGIDSAAGKQKIVVELYDKFFRNAFPKMAERLGIVYTPVEVVDFIVHGVNHILKTEFGETMGSKNVHILDPFTGTGTFITRLMQSGLISPDELKHKYKNEIHANEIVLLAYYIAAINIEAVYHEVMGGEYVPFEGICLTDTFQMYERDDLVDALLVDNSQRRRRQKGLDIRVIMGNPPYSVGQANANDNNANLKYASLDKRISETYEKRSSAKLTKSLLDSYVRAIRWASDRVKDAGVIGFVTNGGFIDSNSADGLRRTIADEFSKVYVLNLRGNSKTGGDLAKREGGNVFNVRVGIAITFLVKDRAHAGQAAVHYHDIGDYLTREGKLTSLKSARLDTLTWQRIVPNDAGDWINQRGDEFKNWTPIDSGASPGVFNIRSAGVKTNRDAWVYNSSESKVRANVQSMIEEYNHQLAGFSSTGISNRKKAYGSVISRDAKKISWDGTLEADFVKGKSAKFQPDSVRTAIYRPFAKQHVYFDRMFNNSVYRISDLFPTRHHENIGFYALGVGATADFALLASNHIPDVQMIGAGQNGQFFARWTYELIERVGTAQDGLKLSRSTDDMVIDGYRRKDNITDAVLDDYCATYGMDITKDDIFYYIYGLLHSTDYREQFAADLKKMLPRIMKVRNRGYFDAFTSAGRKLADLHLHYENVPMYPATIHGEVGRLPAEAYRVEKMKYARKGKEKDLTTVIYNRHLTIADIPLAAHDYILGSRSALDWVIERHCAKIDKDSGIANDANEWAIETMNNPRYPLELFLRVITVSLDTMKIVRGLPKLDILKEVSLSGKVSS